LGPEVSDVDGNTETRRGTISLFNGARPEIASYASPEHESAAVAEWLTQRIKDGLLPHEMAVFVRPEAQLDRAFAATEQAGLDYKVLAERVEGAFGSVSVSTMHLAKGLEFRAVVVMACDDEVIPLQE
jgi:superfamily I DNA/RNA helicase